MHMRNFCGNEKKIEFARQELEWYSLHAGSPIPIAPGFKVSVRLFGSITCLYTSFQMLLNVPTLATQTNKL